MWGQALLSPAPCMPPQPTTWIESSRRERKCLTLPGGTVQTSHDVGRGWFIWFYKPCMAWKSWKIAYVRFLLRECTILRLFSDPGLVPNAAPIDRPDHRSLAMAPNWGDGGFGRPKFSPIETWHKKPRDSSVDGCCLGFWGPCWWHLDIGRMSSKIFLVAFLTTDDELRIGKHQKLKFF
jgi:hypothetical protein